MIEYVPAAVAEPTAKVTVDVPEPGAAIEVGLKLTVTPVGAPLELNATAELNPPETEVVTVDDPLFPATTETDVGEAASVNAGVAVAVTVSETVVDFASPPPVPVSVIE